MKQIVSANYLDRQSESPWLVRPDEAGAEPKPARGVLVTGATFGPSSEEEAGFGCQIVAHSESVVPLCEAPSTEGFTRIEFSRYDFYPQGAITPPCRIESIEELLLLPDRSMWAKGITYKGE